MSLSKEELETQLTDTLSRITELESKIEVQKL